MLQDEAPSRDDAERQVRRGRSAVSGRRLVCLLPALLIVGGLAFGIATPAAYTAAPSSVPPR